MIMGRQELNPAFPLQVTAHQPLVFLVNFMDPNNCK